MKNIELLHDAANISNNETVKELIKRFILSNEMQKKQEKSKFNLFDYINTSKYAREYQQGIYHIDGLKVATDSFIMAICKEDYSKELEGKIISKKGEEIFAKYPNFKAIIPSNDLLNFVKIDFKKVLDIEKEFKVLKKISKDIKGFVKINDVYFNITLFSKLAKFCMEFNIDSIGVKEYKIAKAYKGDNMILLSPLFLNSGQENDSNIKVYSLI
jgi:hypothetical protein